MARPVKAPATTVTPEETAKDKPTIKNVQMHAGIDMIGSKTSINNSRADIYERATGILVISKETGRKVVIPHANIRGYELI